MNMDNTLIGVTAGTALILVPSYWVQLRHKRLLLCLVRAPADHSGWAELLTARDPDRQGHPAFR